jgi:hypothetical protein
MLAGACTETARFTTDLVTSPILVDLAFRLEDAPDRITLLGKGSAHVVMMRLLLATQPW